MIENGFIFASSHFKLTAIYLCIFLELIVFQDQINWQIQYIIMLQKQYNLLKSDQMRLKIYHEENSRTPQ